MECWIHLSTAINANESLLYSAYCLSKWALIKLKAYQFLEECNRGEVWLKYAGNIFIKLPANTFPFLDYSSSIPGVCRCKVDKSFLWMSQDRTHDFKCQGKRVTAINTRAKSVMNAASENRTKQTLLLRVTKKLNEACKKRISSKAYGLCETNGSEAVQAYDLYESRCLDKRYTYKIKVCIWSKWNWDSNWAEPWLRKQVLER